MKSSERWTRGRSVTLAEVIPQRKQESRKRELVPNMKHTSLMNLVISLGGVQDNITVLALGLYISDPPYPSCMILEKIINISEPQFPYL